MFKLMGLLALFAASSLLGIYKTSELKRRKRILIDFQDMILKIYTEMGYFKEPLPIIFQKFMTEKDEPNDIFLRQCCMGQEISQMRFEEKWTDAVSIAYQTEPLKQGDLELFAKCGSFIGQSDYHSQKNHFEIFRTQLDRQISEATDDVRKKGGLYTKAGISIGAVLFIALL